MQAVEMRRKTTEFSRVSFCLLVAVLSLITVLVPQNGAAKSLTLNEALQMAMENNASLQKARAELEEAEAVKKGVIGKFGPSLAIEGNLLYWNDAYDVDLMDYIRFRPDYADLAQVMLTMIAEPLEPVELRSAQTSELSLTMIQPITPLLKVGEGYRAGKAGESAREQMEIRARRVVAYQTIENYLLLIRLRKLEEVAAQAQATIAAHVKQAQDFFNAELIDKNQVLGAEVALANAQQDLIRARSGVALVQARLSQIIGLPIDSQLELTELGIVFPEQWEPSLEQSQSLALEGRQEIAALTNKVRASRAKENMAWWDMTPQIVAIGRYKFSDGSMLSETEEGFVGLAVKWDLFNWGSNYYEVQAEKAKTRQTEIEKRDAQNLIQLEVHKRFVEWESARQRFDVTEKTVGQAKENLRVQQLRFKENLATSVDVLDAQTLLSKASSDTIAARYDMFLSLFALRLVVGENPYPTEDTQEE